MTVAPPVEPVLPPRRRPWGILVLVAVVLAVVAYLAFSNIGSALVYYLTPSELLARGDDGDRRRRCASAGRSRSAASPATRPT